MSVRPLLALTALAATFVPGVNAIAADFVGQPLFSSCAPPPSALTHPDYVGFHAWAIRGDDPRIVDVERYDPHNPPSAVVPTYVQPQTAFLASPLCQFPNGYSDRSWYDGQLFYRPGGVQASPDTFMVIERK